MNLSIEQLLTECLRGFAPAPLASKSSWGPFMYTAVDNTHNNVEFESGISKSLPSTGRITVVRNIPIDCIEHDVSGRTNFDQISKTLH